jgi:hypothetical protein
MTKAIEPGDIEKLVTNLHWWQAIERQSIHDVGAIMEDTTSPFVRLILEIIRHDSLMHHRVQQFLIDDATGAAVTVRREEVAAIWERIEAHDRVERRAIEIAERLDGAAWSPVQKQLFEYLLTDERKHDTLLHRLGAIKSTMPLASGA